MASIYRRGKTWWIKCSTNGVRVQESLHTANERIARSRLHQKTLDSCGHTMPHYTQDVVCLWEIRA
jgi:hypothetical protein